MSDDLPKVRLYVDASLAAGSVLTLTAQAHYITGVMRQQAGDTLGLFNGRDGEWRAQIVDAGKRQVAVMVHEQVRPQRNPPDVWLMFAPIKKARTDFIVEKAAELGAARIVPVLTRHTNAERVRTDRLAAHAIEAAEQCGGTFVPQVAPPQRLDAVLATWPKGRRLMFCDEAQTALPVHRALAGQARGPWAVLVGPEGGFAPQEAAALRALDDVVPVTLGPRILRADTAAVAALTAWQMALGDWE